MMSLKKLWKAPKTQAWPRGPAQGLQLAVVKPSGQLAATPTCISIHLPGREAIPLQMQNFDPKKQTNSEHIEANTPTDCSLTLR